MRTFISNSWTRIKIERLSTYFWLVREDLCLCFWHEFLDSIHKSPVPWFLWFLRISQLDCATRIGRELLRLRCFNAAVTSMCTVFCWWQFSNCMSCCVSNSWIWCVLNGFEWWKTKNEFHMKLRISTTYLESNFQCNYRWEIETTAQHQDPQ